MRSLLFAMTACLLAAPAPLHAQAGLLAHTLPALPQGAEPRIGRYVEFIVDDTGTGLAAGVFELPLSPGGLIEVVFPEDIETAAGFPKPLLQVALDKRKAAIYSKRRQLDQDMQRNVTLSSASIMLGLMVRPAKTPDEAITLAVVRRRSEVERWQARYDDYAAARDELRGDRAALDFVLEMHATPVQPQTVLGDVAPRAKDVAEVTISEVRGVWSGPDKMVVKFELENTGTTTFDWAESQVYGQDRQVNHARVAGIRMPAEPAAGLVGRLPPGERAPAAILVERTRDIAGPMTIVLGEKGGGRPVMVTVGNWMPLQTSQNVQNIQMMELRPVEPPDPERGKVSLHLQGVYGAIWLGDGAGLDQTDATSLTGLGVRAQYAFNRYIAVEGEAMGASTGEAHFDDVAYEGMQGDLARSASLGRMQFGGVLRIGEGPYVPLLRLGFGGQGVSHAATFNGMEGPDVPFEFSALWYGGAGLDIRLGNHFIAGIALSLQEPSSGSRSLEAGLHLGYAWKP